MRGRRRLGGFVLLALSLGVGCQLLAGIDSRDVGTMSDAEAPESSADGGAEAAVSHDAGAEAATPECSGTAGPASIHIKDGNIDFCIDRTEVTHGQYLAFAGIANPVVAVSPLRAECSTWLAPALPPDDPDAFPARNIAWCDAWAYCKWAGKRLCGQLDGAGTLSPAQLNDPKHDEWFFACTKGGAQPLPYGASEIRGACDVGDAGVLGPVASFPACVGAYPDLHDMVGSISEFYDTVELDDAGKPTYWGHRSSSWRDGDNSSCASISAIDDGTHVYDGIGFRCCASPL